MTRLGIVAALAAEAHCLQRHLRPAHGTADRQQDVMVCVSGMGPRRAVDAGSRLLQNGATALLSWGTAAALDRSLTPGQIVLPCSVLSSDGVPVTLSMGWMKRLNDRLRRHFDVCDQPLITTRDVLMHPKEKHRLHLFSRAAAADMESAALAELAESHDVPFVVLRAIADTAATEIPDWSLDAIDEFGKARYMSMLVPLLSQVRSWPALIQLAVDFHKAIRVLGAVCKHAGSDAFWTASNEASDVIA